MTDRISPIATNRCRCASLPLSFGPGANPLCLSAQSHGRALRRRRPTRRSRGGAGAVVPWSPANRRRASIPVSTALARSNGTSAWQRARSCLVLPGPAIPFQGCRYFQRVSVDLEAGAQFIWGDIWLAGRYARAALSERFQFRSLIQDLTVRRAGQLVFRDRFCWQGPWDEETAHWHFGLTEAYGSLFSTIGQSTDASPLEREHDPAPVRTREAIFQTAALHTCRRWLGSTEAVIAAVTRSVQPGRCGRGGWQAMAPDGPSPGAKPLVLRSERNSHCRRRVRRNELIASTSQLRLRSFLRAFGKKGVRPPQYLAKALTICSLQGV